jgi:hypothetical protein
MAPVASTMGQQFADALGRADHATAQAISAERVQRYLADNLPQMRAALPLGTYDLLSQGNGACLPPFLEDGDFITIRYVRPKPLQFAFIQWARPATPQVKIYLGPARRGDVILAEFGERQPDSVHTFAQTNPLAIAQAADFDIAALHLVTGRYSETTGYQPIDEATFTAEHRAGINETFGTVVLLR